MKMTKEELNEIIERHCKWLYASGNSQCILSKANRHIV